MPDKLKAEKIAIDRARSTGTPHIIVKEDPFDSESYEVVMTERQSVRLGEKESVHGFEIKGVAFVPPGTLKVPKANKMTDAFRKAVELTEMRASPHAVVRTDTGRYLVRTLEQQHQLEEKDKVGNVCVGIVGPQKKQREVVDRMEKYFESREFVTDNPEPTSSLFWTTADGERLLITDMDDEHLMNTLRYVMRKRIQTKLGQQPSTRERNMRREAQKRRLPLSSTDDLRKYAQAVKDNEIEEYWAMARRGNKGPKEPFLVMVMAYDDETDETSILVQPTPVLCRTKNEARMRAMAFIPKDAATQKTDETAQQTKETAVSIFREPDVTLPDNLIIRVTRMFPEDDDV